MFLAFSSSYRSSDLSRQVGAVISSECGEIIATGCNEVPQKGGGLYWPDDENDARDSVKIHMQFEKNSKKVIFQPFIGIGPRRFIDLFSLQLSDGVKIKRKQQGKIIRWPEKDYVFRFPLLGISYLDIEKSIGAKLNEGVKNGKSKK